MDFTEQHLTAIIETRRDIAELKKDLENFFEQQREYRKSQDLACSSCFEDHEKRIRSLEQFKWTTTGIATSISATIAAIVSVISSYWKGGGA